MNLKFAEIQTFVSDISVAINFYQIKLGLKLIQAEKGWAIFDASGIELVLMAGAQKSELPPYGKFCMSVLCLRSKDIEKDISELESKGVKIIQSIRQVPQGKFAVIADEDNNFIEVIE